MKKLKLNLQHLEGAEVLTREQLKKVLGSFGSNPNCGDGQNDDDWYCCGVGSPPPLHLGFEDCNVASMQCEQAGGTGIVNSQSLC